MKRIYAKGLSASERHRISDAVYRLRKQGFIIPPEVLKNVKDASSYKTIEKKIVGLKGVEYRAIRTDKNGKEYRALHGPSARTAYNLLQEYKKYERERKKAIRKGLAREEDIPKYNPVATGPDERFETKGKTDAEIEKMYEDRFKRVTRKMKKYKPVEISEKLIKQRTDNLLKVMRSTIRQYSRPLYNEIRKRLLALSPTEISTLYDRVGRRVMDSMFSYLPGAFKLGVSKPDGTYDMAIMVFLKELGIDPNYEIKVGGKMVPIDVIING